jgi:hypothetical protein
MRFSEDEKLRLPTLNQIPDSTIDLVEDINRLEKGPSEKILRDLIQAHRLVRRRSVRALVVAAAFAILATASVVASIFWGLAEAARVEEEKQKRSAISAKLVNKADLLRETQGPKLEKSLEHAVEAYKNSKLAGELPVDAERAIQQTLEIRPDRIGQRWLPFGKPTPLRMGVVDERLVLIREDPNQDDELLAIVAELDGDTEQWHVVQQFTKDKHGELVTRGIDGSIEVSDNPRWLLTSKTGQVIVWDIVKGGQSVQLPFDHAPKENDGLELLAINSGAKHAVVRKGRELTVWNLTKSPPRSATLPVEYRFALYAISPTGEMLAWAGQDEFVVMTIRDGKKVLHYPITQGGGREDSLRFIEGTSYQRDKAVFASWSANQTKASDPRARKDAPNWQAGIWYLRRNAFRAGKEAERDTRPDITQVREKPFEIVFSDRTSDLSLAVLDSDNPVQWLDLESQLAFTLGGAAGPGTKAQFGGDSILIVHTDGTARLWDVKHRRELLRFTVQDGTIVDIAFLNVRSENKARNRAVVTLDTRWHVQGWTSQRGSATVESLTLDKGE